MNLRWNGFPESGARVRCGFLIASVAALALPAHAAGPVPAHTAGHNMVRSRAKARPSLPRLVMSAVLPVAGVLADAEDALPEEGKKYELKLANLHTGEALNVVYRVGDTYLPEAIDKLNHFLRDSHNEDVSSYDPREFDVLHTVLGRLGRPGGVIDIVCGYRSPETNEMLRQGSTAKTGVAEHSQHILAKAIDIRVPGEPTARVRDAALSLEAGGVGYYPVSQFVHVDVGPVRTWVYAPRAAHAKHRKRRA